MKKLIPLVMIAVLLLTSCLPGNMQMPQSPLLSQLERKSGLIAYVGKDGNIYVSDQAGGHKTAYTEDASMPQTQAGPFHYYLYPTWSQDSNHLAFVGLTGENGTTASSTLNIANIDTKTSKKVYSSDTENPIYLYWSPDDKNLSYLSTTITGTSMLLQSIPADGGQRSVIDMGAPYYWSWSPDGSSMIVHTGSETSSIPVHLSFLHVGDDVVEDQLDTVPASFQAPAWSPNGEHILLSRVNDKKENEIIMADAHGKFEKSIGLYDFASSFVWSYDSELVAYIDGVTPMTAGTLGELHVYDTNNSEDFFQDSNVVAAFWSPNSKKLAYIKPILIDPETGKEVAPGSSSSSTVLVLVLYVLDVNSAKSKEILKFQPTNQFLAILSYYDQYHQSMTFWSPDSNNLVLSLLISDNASGVAIIPASGQVKPRLLDEGLIAFWSWK